MMNCTRIRVEPRASHYIGGPVSLGVRSLCGWTPLALLAQPGIHTPVTCPPLMTWHLLQAIISVSILLTSPVNLFINRNDRPSNMTAESSRQAADPAARGWSRHHIERGQWIAAQPIDNQGGNSPDVLFGKIIKLTKKIRGLKKRAIFIQREVRWLKTNDSSALAVSRVIVYEAELATRKAALQEAEAARQYYDWHLRMVLEQANADRLQHPAQW